MLKIKKIVKKVFFIYLAFSCQLSALSFEHYKSKLTFTNNCSLENKQYAVKKVFDGDTIIVGKRDEEAGIGGDGEKIRFLGIDAFEHNQNIYGTKAKDFLSMLLLNQTVCIETDVQKNDVYGRTLGYVFVNGSFINEELLKNGLALLYDFPPNVKYISRLKKAQIYGRENMLGIWKEHGYILETPSQWRHKHPFKKENKSRFP